MKIRFNKPYLAGKELYYIAQTVISGRTSGNQDFTKKCQAFFKERFGFTHNLLTTSCTDALEMSALLLDIKAGDEVIVPSYTFVSTANAFVLRGARIIFADSCPDNPNIDATKLEALITPKTKAIVIVHYGGIACDMDAILSIASRHNVAVVEDAAQAIDSYYKGLPLGSFGDFAAFSFHETKNLICGEGGLLTVNNAAHQARAEIIWEKGTNRSAFYRGEVNKYGWMDVGSSFLPSEILAAFLYAQLENMDDIQTTRKRTWSRYALGLKNLEEAGKIELPVIPEYATVNGHLFHIVCADIDERTRLIAHLKSRGIHAVFHYISLHSSPYFEDKHDGRSLPYSDRFTNCLLRLPFYYELSDSDQDFVIDAVQHFYG